jgi:uncharacterized protein YjbI with pentapeptide repeats
LSLLVAYDAPVDLINALVHRGNLKRCPVLLTMSILCPASSWPHPNTPQKKENTCCPMKVPTSLPQHQSKMQTVQTQAVLPQIDLPTMQQIQAALPSGQTTAFLLALGVAAGAGVGAGITKSLGDQIGKQIYPFSPDKSPVLKRQKSLEAGEKNRKCLKTLGTAEQYFTRYPSRALAPNKWTHAIQGDNVVQALTELHYEDQLSGKNSSYEVNDMPLNFPGAHIKNMVLQASKQPLPLKLWLSQPFKNKAEMKAAIKAFNNERTDKRVDTQTFAERQQAEKDYPPRNRAYLGGFSVPYGLIEQCYVQAGSLKDGNISHAKVRRLDLNESKLTNLTADHTDIEKSDWSDTTCGGLNLSHALVKGLLLNRADLGANDGAAPANLQGMQAPYVHYSSIRQKPVVAPLQMAQARLAGTNLQQARLEGANLKQANMQQALLKKAELLGCDMTKAQLKGALGFHRAQVGAFTTPKGAVLPANLKQADVSGLSFYGKELSAMALQGACLNNTRLSNALWHGEQLDTFLIPISVLSDG